MALSLETVFKQFCAFGAGKAGTAMMDGAKFGKLCRDTKLLDKKLTSTDVDIIFSRVKAKTDRKITFKQFEEAVGLLAEKKYPGAPNGLAKITALITSSKTGPATHSEAAKTVSSDVVDRMTDTSKYTGAHKQRFDESGKGKGLEGRDSIAKGKGMIPGSVSSQASYVAGYKHEGSYSSSPKSSPKPPKSKHGDVLDRLTDTSQYTGSHKQRFDGSGRGRGLEGRDAPAKGPAMSPGSVESHAAYVTGYKHEGTYGKK